MQWQQTEDENVLCRAGRCAAAAGAWNEKPRGAKAAAVTVCVRVCVSASDQRHKVKRLCGHGIDGVRLQTHAHRTLQRIFFSQWYHPVVESLVKNCVNSTNFPRDAGISSILQWSLG